jgi:hypothetical protein
VLAVSIFRVHFLDYVKMEIACGPSLWEFTSQQHGTVSQKT